MSDKPKDGGPAFPSVDLIAGDERGMTIRDYFAAQALNGFLAANARFADNDSPDSHAFAVAAYRVADAMIEARSKP